MKESPSHAPLYLAVALGSVAITVGVLVSGLLFGLRWLVSQPLAFNNPAYMAVIVAGALVVGFGMAGVFLILHDAVDAWGDAMKAKAGEPPAVDPATAKLLAEARKANAGAAALEQGLTPPGPSWADSGAPWPAAENGAADAPGEWRG